MDCRQLSFVAVRIVLVKPTLIGVARAAKYLPVFNVRGRSDRERENSTKILVSELPFASGMGLVQGLSHSVSGGASS